MPSVANLFRKAGLRWRPDADAVGAPDGSLLKATNLVPDPEGALELRRGSEIVYSGLSNNVNSLYTAVLSANVDMVTPADTTVRMAAADNTIYLNGSTLTTMEGSGDVAFGDDSRQVFFARAGSRKKYDGATVRNWSIPAPTLVPTLAAVASITSTIASFDADEDPAVTATEGSAAATSDQSGVADDAIILTPDSSTNRGVLEKLWTTDQDFFDISGVDGSETDLVDFYIKLENPRNVKSITVVFGLDDSSTEPFKDNRFEFEFELDGVPIQLKDPVSEGYGSYETAVGNSITGVLPSDVTGIATPQDVKDTLDAIGSTPSPKSNAPGDNIWSHLTITRGQFERIGNDYGRGWSTVRGFKIIYKTRKGKNPTLTLSDALFVGGGDRALTGTYRCVVQAVRPVEDDNDNVIYYQKSPPSPATDPINLNHQTLQITISDALLQSLDPQATQLWVYLFGGWLDTYYRFAVTPTSVNQGMTIDELNTPVGSDMDTAVKRTRITSWGNTYTQTNGDGQVTGTGSSNIVLTLRTSELDALTQDIKLEPYLIEVPENIIDIAGPYLGRMWVLTNEGFLYPSTLTSPAAFNSLQVIDLSQYGRPKWLAVTGTGMYAGMEKDVLAIAGSGQETPDRARADLYAQPLSLAHAPSDFCHWREGNSIIFRSADGLMELVGGSIKSVPVDGVSLLWREQDRHGIQALNVDSGRFRCTADNNMFYMLAPEGDDTSGNVIYRYAMLKSEWSYLRFDQVDAFLSLYNEPDGTLLAGDDAGRVWELEADTNLDNNETIALDLLTPILDGGNPLAYKDPFDYQAHLNTGGDLVTVNLFKDGSGITSKTFSIFSAEPGIHRTSLSDLGSFIKLQVSIDGNANTFVLSYQDITFRIRPQRLLNFDTGYYMAGEPGDLLWMQEVELDAIVDSPAFTMYLYLNDVLKWTSDAVTTVVGKRDVYRIPLPRGIKGERPRLVFATSDTSGTGNIGMDPYSVRARVIDSGNKDVNRRYVKLYPAGEAP